MRRRHFEAERTSDHRSRVAIGCCFCVLLAGAAPLRDDVVSPPPAAAHPSVTSRVDYSAIPAADASAEVDGDIRLGASGRLDVRLRNVDLIVALELLSEQTQRNIVVKAGVTGSVSTILRGVTFAEALRAILDANNLTWDERDNLIFVRPAPASDTETRIAHDLRIFHLKYVAAADVEPIVKPLLSEDCSVTRTAPPEKGVAPNKQQAGGLSPAGEEVLVVVAPPPVLDRVSEVIKSLDVRPQQVLVEATIMRATLNENNALGIDFNVLSGVDLKLLGAESPGVTSVSVGSVPKGRLNETAMTFRTDFNDLAPGGGFTFGILKDHVAAFIRALEQVTDVMVMANPKIVTLNKQRGEIIVGRRDGYLTTTVTETASVQTVEFLETGTRLIFRPFITGDGYIRVEIHPEDSNGGLNPANLPFQETTEATTNVLIRDGNTILIGGLFRERTQSTKNRVPWLANVPVVGRMLGIDQDSTTREEVIILMTVRILKDNAVEQEANEALIQDLERMRVGARDSLMWTGRERLAQAHYHWALQHLAAGRLDDALFDARMAIHIHPRHIDAIRLHERLVGQRTWDIEGTRMRDFVQEVLRGDAGLPPSPLYDRPDVTRILEDAGSAAIPTSNPVRKGE